MESEQTTGIDLPLKALVWQDALAMPPWSIRAAAADTAANIISASFGANPGIVHTGLDLREQHRGFGPGPNQSQLSP
jgi:hypothetical protein